MHSIIEYSHRTVGAITGVLLIATLIAAWIVFRRTRPVVAWLATGSLVAIAAEGVLGGVVVINELAPWLVLVHLGLAMVILGLLLAAAVMSLPAATGTPDRRLGIAAVATYLLVLTGSSVVASGADQSCNAWPVCGNGFALDFAGANAFTMLHRGAALVVGVFLVYVMIAAMRSAVLRPIAIATLAVFLVQVGVGAGAAITGAGVFDGLHVAIATLVWAGVLLLALLSLPRADRVASFSRLAVEKHPA